MEMKIDLLSFEEARKLPVEILQCKAPKSFNGFIDNRNRNCRWWLRSPGYFSDYAVLVEPYGTFCGCGNGFIVYCDNIAVRPALRIEKALIEKLPRTKKGYVVYLDTKWIDISEYIGNPCLLKKKCLREASYFDLKSNDCQLPTT